MGIDAYKILGVSRDASDEEIKRAYRRLALRWHPDKNQGNKEAAEEKFKEIGCAFDALKDAARRAAYEREEATAAAVSGAAFRAPAGRRPAGAADPFGAQAGWQQFGFSRQQSFTFVDAERLFSELFGRGRSDPFAGFFDIGPNPRARAAAGRSGVGGSGPARGVSITITTTGADGVTRTTRRVGGDAHGALGADEHSGAYRRAHDAEAEARREAAREQAELRAALEASRIDAMEVDEQEALEEAEAAALAAAIEASRRESEALAERRRAEAAEEAAIAAAIAASRNDEVMRRARAEEERQLCIALARSRVDAAAAAREHGVQPVQRL
ncbi:hypothetical protein KFE25_008610 [Diacronema lutheri]|mgnify:CR=1 FL=1|uniref:J domain-containing protein n=1 Tax=Diacronema lutheri TaxID=2081491 RepID=A0A8J5XTE9_DIALT|nr:hypothetical protein KFE25_008610 [Diacronema lutheri]